MAVKMSTTAEANKLVFGLLFLFSRKDRQHVTKHIHDFKAHLGNTARDKNNVRGDNNSVTMRRVRG